MTDIAGNTATADGDGNGGGRHRRPSIDAPRTSPGPAGCGRGCDAFTWAEVAAISDNCTVASSSIDIDVIGLQRCWRGDHHHHGGGPERQHEHSDGDRNGGGQRCPHDGPSAGRCARPRRRRAAATISWRQIWTMAAATPVALPGFSIGAAGCGSGQTYSEASRLTATIRVINAMTVAGGGCQWQRDQRIRSM